MGSFPHHLAGPVASARCQGMMDGSGSTEVQEMVTASSTGSRRTLREEVPPDVRRGVRLDKVLACGGRHLHLKEGSLALGTAASNLHHLSQSCDRLDSFISHDWATGGTAKYIALSLHYNHLRATIASICSGLVVILLKLYYVHHLPLYDYPWFHVIGGTMYSGREDACASIVMIGVYVVMLFGGQRITAALGLVQSKIVFFDRICVDQENEERKQAAVLGLAGFLQISDSMLVLWSSRTFTRLWCVFEVATWMRLGRSLRSIKFLPLSLYVILFMSFVNGVLIVLVMARVTVQLTGNRVVWVVVNLLTVLIVAVIPHALAHKLSNDMCIMEDQLRTFSIRRASCFCCSENHRHPVTGEVVPCDRELVYGSLANWYSGYPAMLPAASSEPHLDNFDSLVRRSLGAGGFVGSTDSLGSYCLHTCIVGIPMLARFFDLAHIVVLMPAGPAVRLACSHAVFTLCLMPLSLRLQLIIPSRLFSTGFKARFPVTTWIAGFLLLYLAIVTITLAQEITLYSENPLPQLFVTVFIMVLVVVAYRVRRSPIRRDAGPPIRRFSAADAPEPGEPPATQPEVEPRVEVDVQCIGHRQDSL